MHLILTGASGSVGYAVLKFSLAQPQITKVSILARRPLDIPFEGKEKSELIIHEDFTTYPDALLEKLKGAHGCIWAQGISQSEVSKEEYERITYDSPIAAARAFGDLSNKFNFVYVSGEGADQSEKAWTLFGRVKGRAEKDLLALANSKSFSGLSVYNARPAGVYPIRFYKTRPAVQRYAYPVLIPFLKLLPNYLSPSDRLAVALVGLATGDGSPVQHKDAKNDGYTLPNVVLRQLGGW
ncbi:hypothetical protein V1511DRAFT_461216 [Dipodascopsis uninucleata]